jgi:hypothetical protein
MVVQTWASTRQAPIVEGPPRRACQNPHTCLQPSIIGRLARNKNPMKKNVLSRHKLPIHGGGFICHNV